MIAMTTVRMDQRSKELEHSVVKLVSVILTIVKNIGLILLTANLCGFFFKGGVGLLLLLLLLLFYYYYYCRCCCLFVTYLNLSP